VIGASNAPKEEEKVNFLTWKLQTRNCTAIEDDRTITIRESSFSDQNQMEMEMESARSKHSFVFRVFRGGVKSTFLIV
jgi:hypothetical protein